MTAGLVFGAAGYAQTPSLTPGSAPTLVVGDFAASKSGALPDDWRPLTFPDIKSHTRYAAVPDSQFGQVVEAKANASASGLMRKVDLDPRAWPTLQWRWKTDRLVAKADSSRKDGDDYPTRIYVSFAYDPRRVSLLERARYGAAKLFYGEYPPQSGLNYIWDNKLPVESIVTNAYTQRVRMIVVQSGPDKLGQWLSYERNIVDDYRKAFGEDPPKISGIAIMTDTDNTGDSVTAWYGDITLRRAGP
ncbi:MAG: DUF3047 domain-containing protein [Betaproteobacteria bacterium]